MDLEWHGPRDDEGAPLVRGPARRVAVLADVHGNAAALHAVLVDVDREDVDLVVFCGDLSWGPDPSRVIRTVQRLGDRAIFIRGNADRIVVDLARGRRRPQGHRDQWMVDHHSASSVGFFSRFPFAAVINIAGLGAVRFCHGSPRSDTELITPNTPAGRIADVTGLMPERILVSGHTHLQFDRVVGDLRSINPGSVGLPYHDGPPGTAYWALLGETVELRSTVYDVQSAIARCLHSGDPGGRRVAHLLLSPPSVSAVVRHAEQRIFSD